MRLFPKTEHAMILLASKNLSGIYSVLSLQATQQQLPGVPIRLEIRRPLYEQLTDYVCTHIVPGLSPLALDWWREEPLELTRDGNAAESFPLFLAQVRQETEKMTIPIGYAAILLPQLLQSMPKDKNRIAYLKAWQVLLGTHTEILKAVADKDLSHYNNGKN